MTASTHLEQERELRELHYKFLRELDTSLPVGLPKISTVEAYSQIFEAMKRKFWEARMIRFGLTAFALIVGLIAGYAFGSF